jgi:hypothetical protein
MMDTAPKGTQVFQGGKPRPGSVLMLYGMGGADRYGLALSHVNQGGTLIAWDIGYWDRKGPHDHRKLRMSVNGLHPPAFVMRGLLPAVDRWKASGLRCAPQRPQTAGHVVLVGNGPKSNVIGAEGWAAAKARQIRREMPGVPILYRPKPKRPFDRGVEFDAVDATSPIDAVLAGASLVVCRHSNVAIDACRLGVPVVCDDGAAAAIYPQRLEDREDQPSLATRQEFLRRLAWWQWSTYEARGGLVWPWINGVLNEVRQPVPA